MTRCARAARDSLPLETTSVVEQGMSSVASWRLPVPFKPAHNPMVPRHASARGAKIRAVRPEDRESIAGAFRALHPRSVYQRFFFLKEALSDRELRWVTEPDGNRKVVLVATTGDGADETVVALGQYIRGTASAEVAFIVAEDYQGRGIASRMLRQLTAIAREHGVTQFEADVLADNTAMLKIFRRSKLPISESEADGVIHLTLSLGDHGRAWRAIWRRLRCGIPSRARPEPAQGTADDLYSDLDEVER